MAGIKVKCKFCKADIQKLTAYNPSPRNYYCNEGCFNTQNAKTKQKVEEQKIISQETSEYNALRDRIYDLYERDENLNWSVITKQIKKLKDDNNFTWRGMDYTLMYYYDICEKEFDVTYGFAWVIERFYLEARDFYKKTKLLGKKAKQIDLNNNTIVMVKGKDKETKKYKEIDFN